MYKDAKKISLHLPYVLTSYARLLTKLSRYKEANEFMKHASEIEPENFHVWYSWGVIKKFQKQTKEAESKFLKAL